MNRIFSHVGTDPIHGARKALAAAQKAGEQFLVVNRIAPEGHELDAPRGAIRATFLDEILDHAETLGLLSYTVKDNNPSAARVCSWDFDPMSKRDPFIEGLRIILAENPEIKPAPLAVSAGMDASTLRKALAGDIGSMTVQKADRLAKVLGYHLSTIIALGEHSDGHEIARLAFAIHKAGPEAREEIDSYLRVKLSQASSADASAHNQTLP